MDNSVFVAPRALLGVMVFSFLLFVAGVALIVSGFFLEGQRHMVFDIYSDTFALALFLFLMIAITSGILFSDMSFYRGGLSSNSCQTMMMSFTVTLICTMELAAFLSGTVMRTEVERQTRSNLFKELRFYNKSVTAHQAGLNRMIAYVNGYVEKELAIEDVPEIEGDLSVPPLLSGNTRNYMDMLQRWLRCCGIDSPKDWKVHYSEDSVPESCCIVPSISCGFRTASNASVVYLDGCITTFNQWMDQDVLLFSIASLLLCILQVSGILLVSCLKRSMANKRLIEPM